MSETSTAPSWSRRLRPGVLLALIVALHAARLDGPLTDGQHGNCAGMFGLFARNAETFGGLARWVPVINPVPPDDLGAAEFYTHHPPLLTWLNQLVMAVPGLGYLIASRVAALLLSWWAACLAAALMARASGGFAGWVAGVTMLALPAGLHHGTLVNYETIAIPAALGLWWVLSRPERASRGPALLAGVWAALADWVALFPLAWSWRGAAPRARRAAAAGAGLGLLGCAWLFQSVSEGSLADTLAQGLAVSPLAPDFSLATWAGAQARHFAALFGGANALLVLGALAAWVPPAGRLLGASETARRQLRAFIAFGGANLVVFARHATGHEHYALLMLPAVAASVALVLDGARQRARGTTHAVAETDPATEAAPRPAAPLAAGLLVVLVVLLAVDSGRRYRAQRVTREHVGQFWQAVALRPSLSEDAVHLRPDGVSFVFLYAARRHVVPFPVGSFGQARELARAHRERFGVPPGDTRIVLLPEDDVPDWLARRPPDGDDPVGHRSWTLPSP